MESSLVHIETWQQWAREEYPRMDARKLVILEALRMCNSRTAACAIVKITYASFSRWMQEDEEFKEAVEQAEALSEIDLVAIVKNASRLDWRAAWSLIQVRHRKEWASAEQRLAEERLLVEQQRREAGLLKAQAEELVTRSRRNTLEASMWQKQFVTEEDQESMIQTLASEVNKPLLQLTPEKFASLVKDKTPEEQLEVLKGYLGRSQADVVEAVLSRGASTGESYADEEESATGEEDDETDSASRTSFDDDESE